VNDAAVSVVESAFCRISKHFVEIRICQQVSFLLPLARKKGFLNQQPKAATPKAATPKASTGVSGYLAQSYSTMYTDFEKLPLGCIIEMLKHADGERFNEERTDIMSRDEADCCLLVGFGIYNSTRLLYRDKHAQLEAMASEYQRRKCPLRDMSIQDICKECEHIL